MIILDTDHLTVLQDQRNASHSLLTSKLSASVDRDIFTTVISLEEQMRGWLSLIKRSKDVAKQVLPYDQLLDMVAFYCDWDVLRFGDSDAIQFKKLRKQKIRIGTQDLKIASIALDQNALLLSGNLKDFGKVPSLQVDDWLR